MRVLENILGRVHRTDRHLAADRTDDFARRARFRPCAENAAHEIRVGDRAG